MTSGQEIRHRRDGTAPFDGVWSRSRPMRPRLPIVVFSDVDGVDCARAASFTVAANTLSQSFLVTTEPLPASATDRTIAIVANAFVTKIATLAFTG